MNLRALLALAILKIDMKIKLKKCPFYLNNLFSKLHLEVKI